MAKAAETEEGKMVPLTPLLNIIECVVCLETVRTPYYMCKTGHLMCKLCITGGPGRCISGNVHCPKCTQYCCPDESILVTKLLAAIPHRCKHFANGCKIIVEPGDKHVTYCKFRMVTCKSSCQDKVPVFKLIEHYQEKHKTTHIFDLPSGSLLWNGFNNNDNININGTPLGKLGSNFYWLDAKFKSGFFEVTFNVHLIENTGEDHYIHIGLDKGEQGHVFKLKANLDGMIDNSSFKMKISHSDIEWFVNEEKKFRTSYEIYTKPKSK